MKLRSIGTLVATLFLVSIIGTAVIIHPETRNPVKEDNTTSKKTEVLPLVASGDGNDALTISGDQVIYQRQNNLYAYNFTTGQENRITDNSARNILRGVNTEYYLVETANKTGDYFPGFVRLVDKKNGASKLLLTPQRNGYDRKVVMNDRYVVWVNGSKLYSYEISSGKTQTIQPASNWFSLVTLRGSYCAILAQYRNHTEAQIYNLDTRELLLSSPKSVTSYCVVMTDRFFAWSEESKNDSYIVLNDVETGSERRIPTPRIDSFDVNDGYIIWEYGGKLHLYPMDGGEDRILTCYGMQTHRSTFVGSKVYWQDQFQVWGSQVYSYDTASGVTSALTNTAGGNSYKSIGKDMMTIYQSHALIRSTAQIVMFLNTDGIKTAYPVEAQKANDVTKKFLEDTLGENYCKQYIVKPVHYFTSSNYMIEWKYRIQYDYKVTIGNETFIQNILIYLNSDYEIVGSEGLPSSGDRQPYTINRGEASRIAINYTKANKIDRVEEHFQYVTNPRDVELNEYVWIVSIYSTPGTNAWSLDEIFVDPSTGRVLDKEGLSCIAIS